MASTKITQIDNKSCTVAWSPHKSHADVIALGTKDSGGIGFEDYGGELDLYDLNLGGDEPKLLKTVKTTTRFGSLAWSTEGFIAGGMSDGSLHLWKFQDLLDGKDTPIKTIKDAHKTEIKALHFHPLAPHKLASGGSDGQVVIFDLSQSPNIVPQALPSSSSIEVTQIAWNTQVEHIVASAHADGLVTVWDLKQMKPWCQLRSPETVSDIQWNPTQGLHLVTASSDDRNPIIKLWDLRASTSMPLATLQGGHSQGILSIDWCPHDDTLLVSSGKDNRTILWDLLTLQPIADIPNDVVDNQNNPDASGADLNSSATNIYSAAAAQQKRYHVQWSPLKRGVIATCSLDRKVQAHSVNGLVTKCGRPPKWLKPNSGVSCGFGGIVLAFGGTATTNVVTMSTVVEEPKLAKASARLEAAAATETTEFCAQMASSSILPGDKEIWAFMQVIFQANARSQLLEHLGFHPEVIQKAATEFTESEKDVATAGVAGMSLEDSKGMSPAAEKAVQDALVVGNFEAAVECCFRTGNLADALILASCGGADLWQKAQERYFESEMPKKAFLGVVNAVISNQLDVLVDKMTNWQETLAIVSTYAKSEDFPSLCIKLGDKLEAAGDSRNASLCYMCSLSLERAVKYWKKQLDRKGSSNLLALHDFCRKVSVFMRANPTEVLEPEIAAMFDKYATVLADQGMLVSAAKYVKSSTELKDRLYRSKESPNCLAAMGNVPPDFPFAMQAVNKAPAARPQQQQASGYGQQQQQQQAGYGRQPQQAAYGQQQQQQQQQQQSGYQQQPAKAAVQQPAVQKPQQAPVAQQPPASDQLPAGWVALQDPTSGRTYYANQTTGQTAWEKPQAAPASTPNPVAATNGGSTMASKYGDGFVSSASHPELAEQYGNVGTSNPYTSSSRPGTAKAVLTSSGVSKAPVSGTFNPSNMPDISEDNKPIKDGFLELVTHIQGMQLTVGDKKQLAEGEKGVAILVKRMARGDVDATVAGKILAIINALRAGDYNTALSTQTGLVNSDWREHKDWLKGIKNLIQLATKKMQGR